MSLVNINEYKKYYNDNCKSLHSLTFGKVKNGVVNRIKSKKCPAGMKMLFGEWLFRKIYMYFSMGGETLQEVCDHLKPAVEECKDTILKASYLHYQHIDASGLIAIHYYFNRFNDQDKDFILQMLNDVQLVKYYVQHTQISKNDLKTHFIEWLKKTPVFEQQSNLLDVLLKYYASDREVQRIYNVMRFGKAGKGTVYQDEQNVHDEDIKLSVINVAQKLIEWSDEELKKDRERSPIYIGGGLTFRIKAGKLLYDMCRNEKEKSIAKCVVERMCIDTTDFTTEKGTHIKISDVFLAVMNYIYKSENKENFILPLMEELEIMHQLCASGYIARFINVLSGFDDRFEISMDFEKQLYAALSHKLHLALEKASDEVAMGSYEEEYKDVYVDFVKSIINKEMKRLIDDYGKEDVTMFIAQVAEKLTGVKWMVKDCGEYIVVEEEW